MKRYNDAIRMSSFVRPVFETPDQIGNWFGYYNYDTLNHDHTKMLCHRVVHEEKAISSNMTVECGYYDLTSGEWHSIGISDSYNWPQGTMLQWIPGRGNENLVIYNSSKEGCLVSIIHDIISGEDKVINWPIYGLTPDGKKSIALNLERSYWCRAYHYYSVVNMDYDVRVADDDGIFEINLTNNTKKRIVDIHDVINQDKEPYFDLAKHWLEHVMVSPDGKRFCFLHRFTIGDLANYETRLFIADIDGNNLHLVEGWRNNYWSHFGWNGGDAFVIYTYAQTINNGHQQNQSNTSEKGKSAKTTIKNLYRKMPSGIQKYINRFVRKGSRYYQYYEMLDGRAILKKQFGNNQFLLDGHPSFTNEGRYMLTDTYPDEKGKQHLYVYATDTGKVIELLSVDAIIAPDRYLCDLHPKLSRDNTFVAIDAAYHGKHHMLLFEIDWHKVQSALN